MVLEDELSGVWLEGEELDGDVLEGEELCGELLCDELSDGEELDGYELDGEVLEGEVLEGEVLWVELGLVADGEALVLPVCELCDCELLVSGVVGCDEPLLCATTHIEDSNRIAVIR